ncbi:MAG: hypothetical protein KZQ93_13765 [Candidatus Thiodiazotropha sp. (ex Monitilora ramsayi)]|nr:hypothetical protein [Candidatus Thiodiazotropha sp. (ex Monitilora ramsayi)]
MTQASRLQSQSPRLQFKTKQVRYGVPQAVMKTTDIPIACGNGNFKERNKE